MDVVMDDTFLLAQWVIRALLALYFLFIGTSMFLPAQLRASLDVVGKLLPRASRVIVVGAAVVAIVAGLALLLPWWGPRFAAGIVLIALLIALFPIHTAIARRADARAADKQATVSVRVRAVVQVVIALLILFAII